MFLNSLLDCVFSDSGKDFHRDAPENVRLVSNRTIPVVGILNFNLIWSECKTSFKQDHSSCRDIEF